MSAAAGRRLAALVTALVTAYVDRAFPGRRARRVASGRLDVRQWYGPG
jgi:hypothetical protein